MINPVVVIAAEIIMKVDSQILMPYIDTPENSTVRVGTINVGGLMGNVPYVEDILENIDILAIQEHWLYSCRITDIFRLYSSRFPRMGKILL